MWEGFELALWLTRWGSQTSDSLQVWETKGTRWPTVCGSMMKLLQVQICFKRFLTFQTAFFSPWCFSLSCASCSCSLGYIPNQKSNVVQVKLRLGSSCGGLFERNLRLKRLCPVPALKAGKSSRQHSTGCVGVSMHPRRRGFSYLFHPTLFWFGFTWKT